VCGACCFLASGLSVPIGKAERHIWSREGTIGGKQLSSAQSGDRDDRASGVERKFRLLSLTFDSDWS
jgi:hypothetical protein